MSEHFSKSRSVHWDSFKTAVLPRVQMQKMLRTVSGNRRDAVHPKYDRLGIIGRIAEAMRAAASEAKAVAGLECPAFRIDGELHLALDHEACFLAVMRIE